MKNRSQELKEKLENATPVKETFLDKKVADAVFKDMEVAVTKLLDGKVGDLIDAESAKIMKKHGVEGVDTMSTSLGTTQVTDIMDGIISSRLSLVKGKELKRK